MSREVLILREPEIRALLDPRCLHRCHGTGFRCLFHRTGAIARSHPSGYSRRRSARKCSPQNRGEIHVKAGYLNGGPYYAVKIVSGFPNNPQLGLPANDGMIVVFDARTGAPAAFLLDNGFITDFRTGAAGAVAAKYLARAENFLGCGDRNRRAGAISDRDAGSRKNFQRSAHMGTRSR